MLVTKWLFSDRFRFLKEARWQQIRQVLTANELKLLLKSNLLPTAIVDFNKVVLFKTFRLEMKFVIEATVGVCVFHLCITELNMSLQAI